MLCWFQICNFYWNWTFLDQVMINLVLFDTNAFVSATVDFEKLTFQLWSMMHMDHNGEVSCETDKVCYVNWPLVCFSSPIAYFTHMCRKLVKINWNQDMVISHTLATLPAHNHFHWVYKSLFWRDLVFLSSFGKTYLKQHLRANFNLRYLVNATPKC